MAAVHQITYDVPAQIREEVYISEKVIDLGKLSWENIGVYLGTFLMVSLPLALAGIVLDLVSSRSSENFFPSNTVMFISALFCILLVIMIGRFVMAKRAADRLDRLVDVLSYELDDWLMDNHRIFLDDDRLEEISVNFLDSVESVQFIYGYKTYIISQAVGQQPEESEVSENSDATSIDSDVLVEKIRHIWAPELNNAYERVSKNIEDLENMKEGALTPEEQHVVTRAQLNLHEVMVLTKKISQFDKMKDEDTQKVLNMLYLMNEELTCIHNNRADAVRRELAVLHDVVVGRNSSSSSMKLN